MLATRLPLTGAALAEPLDMMRPGMHALDTVRDVIAFTPVRGGATYRILRTTEVDTYEAPPEAPTVAPLSDNYAGHARMAAKLSTGAGPTERFVDVSALIAALPADHAMIHHVPPIDTSSASIRLPEEQRNIHVVGFLYAASREADNDFHLIVGRDPATPPEMYMTMEVSGLPPVRNPAFPQLKHARDAFQSFFGTHQPLFAYDFYHPPIPVVIEGSVFFDMTHAEGQAPGPPSLKSRMPTIWEVHPVTAITFGQLPSELEILRTTEADASDEPQVDVR
jgi:hypothetical protein